MILQGVTNVFAPLVGGTSAAARSEYATTVLQDSKAASVAGFCVNLNTLRIPSTASNSPQSNPEEVRSLLTASFVDLPPEKPRLALCPAGPHEMLRLLELGVDMFMDEWTTVLSSVGVALDFSFASSDGQSEAVERSGRRQLGINLFDDSNSDQFVPLSRPALHACLEQTYGLEALGDSPTRGYVHHLLHSHEMTSHVLLAMHNTCIMDLFMRDVRASIQAGCFAEDKKRFERTYAEALDCLEAARTEYARVNRERGKGRLKGLGQERKELDTPIEEQERMSVVDPVSAAV